MNVRRTDAPVAHTWTEADSGPKHDTACTCQKPPTEDGAKTLDEAQKRADAERERLAKSGPPVGSLTRTGVVR